MTTLPSVSKQEHPGVSVVICCYNSANRLGDTLAHLSKQVLPESLNWEIIIVDNASTDHTAAFAVSCWTRMKQNISLLRVIKERNTGQQFARIAGVQAAAFDLVVFCDDDNWLCPSYIATAWQVMNRGVLIGAAAGQNSPVTNEESYPEWFESYQNYYALGTPAASTGDITERGFVLGAGMITRKYLFLEMYADKYPSLLPGRNAGKLSTGDDIEYCKRLILRGWQLYYHKDLKLEHFIPAERLTIAYRDRLMDGISEAGKILTEYDLAIRVSKRYKNKNRLRLLLLTPLRILLVKAGAMNRVLVDEQLTLFYLSPLRSGKNVIRNKIRDFIYKR